MSAAFPEISMNVVTLDMALRDYFAAQALAGILMNYTTSKFGVTETEVARGAYRYADAMIAARERKEDAT